MLLRRPVSAGMGDSGAQRAAVSAWNRSKRVTWAWPSFVAAATLIAASFSPAHAEPEYWELEWQYTDFTRSSVLCEDILSAFGFSGGKDRIPAIDNPLFGTVADAAESLAGTEPVITVAIGGEAKAYPLSILLVHEIVNDVVGDVPVAVTFCPLCNSSVVFNRSVNGEVLDFGVTGNLIHSDLIMYDRQTESWWQQFTGEGIVGTMTGAQLEILPVRIESFDRFRDRFPQGQVMRIPANSELDYNSNPYAGYESRDRPPLFVGQTNAVPPPLSYVVAVDDQAWTLDLLRARGRIVTDDGLILEWTPGRNSVLDTPLISEGRDLGNVTVQRRLDNTLVDVAHDTTFAFAFSAFFPEGNLKTLSD